MKPATRIKKAYGTDRVRMVFSLKDGTYKIFIVWTSEGWRCVYYTRFRDGGEKFSRGYLWPMFKAVDYNSGTKALQTAIRATDQWIKLQAQL